MNRFVEAATRLNSGVAVSAGELPALEVVKSSPREVEWRVPPVATGKENSRVKHLQRYIERVLENTSIMGLD